MSEFIFPGPYQLYELLTLTVGGKRDTQWIKVNHIAVPQAEVNTNVHMNTKQHHHNVTKVKLNSKGL